MARYCAIVLRYKLSGVEAIDPRLLSYISDDDTPSQIEELKRNLIFEAHRRRRSGEFEVVRAAIVELHEVLKP